jgi:hypothetical protein
MLRQESTLTFTTTSPSSALTVVGASIKSPLFGRATRLLVDATITGATGGALDVYIQRKVASDVWRDWIHFTQATAGAAAAHYQFMVTGELTTITAGNGGTDSTPSVSLAAGSFVNVLPGEELRWVFVAGASTSAGAVQTIRITPFVEFG